jgi:hypothetical protein
MPRKSTALPALFLLLIILPCELFAAENWIEVRSAHFTVYTPSSEKQARNIANQFEQIRALFHAAFPQLRTNPAQSVVILAVKGEKGMKELLPEQWEAKGHLHVAGLYQEGFDKHYVILQLDAEGENPYHVLYHEYTHSLLHLNFNHIPLWLDEGLAEYLGNVSFGEKESRIGTVDPSHLYVLQQNRLIPIDTLLAVTHESPYYNESNRASVFYAESWALVHYLMLNQEARQKQLMNHFLAAWTVSHDPIDAARQTFGDLKKFGLVIDGYVRQGSFYNGLVKNPESAADKQLPSRPVSPAELLALRGDFFIHHHRPDAGKPLLEDALKLDPSLALPHTAMASYYFQTQNAQGMQKEASEAIRSGDVGYYPPYLLAVSRWQMGIDNETLRQEVISDLQKCIELNSLFAPAYDLLSQTYATSPETQKEAISNAILAVRARPGELEYAFRLTELLLNNDRDVEAKTLADSISKAAYTSSEREMAGDLVARVANHKDQVANSVANNARSMLSGGAFELGTVAVPNSTSPTPGSDRPPDARKVLLGVDGTVATVDCSHKPEAKLTLNGPGGFLAYHVADVAKLSIAVPENGTAPECPQWIGRKVKLWFVFNPGDKSSGEVTKLNFQ